jgi:hypothetical protein
VRRGPVALAGLFGSGVAAGFVYEKVLSHRSDRLDIYFDDGSFVTYGERSPEAEQLLSLAREVLAAVNS